MKNLVPLLISLSFTLHIFSQSNPSLYEDNELVVIFNENTPQQEIHDLLEELGMEIIEGPTDNFLGYLFRYTDPNLPHLPGNPSDTILGTKKKAKAIICTTGVGLNFKLDSHLSPDPYTAQGDYCYSILNGQANGGNDTETAIFDTGITRFPHVWDNFFEPDLGYNFVQGGAPIDDFGHGTHMSTIIMENLNNNGEEITLRAYKTQDHNGGGTLWQAIKAVDLAITEQIDVVNMSFSYKVESKHTLESKTPFSEAIRIAKAQSGTLFIAAAGNDGTDNDFSNNISGIVAFPASYTNENLISVGSADCSLLI